MKIEINNIKNTSYFPEILGMEDPQDYIIQWNVYFSGWIGWVRIDRGVCIIREDIEGLTLGEIHKKVENIITKEFKEA